MNLFTETIRVRRPGGPTGEYDEMGRPIIGPPTEEDIPAWFEIGSSEEDTAAGDRQVWGYKVHVPLEHTVGSDAEVRILDEWFQVQGTPGVQPSGFLVPGYRYFVVERATG